MAVPDRVFRAGPSVMVSEATINPEGSFQIGEGPHHGFLGVGDPGYEVAGEYDEVRLQCDDALEIERRVATYTRQRSGGGWIVAVRDGAKA